MAPPRKLVAAVALLLLYGCQPQPDPRLQASQDFKSTVFDLIGQDEAQTKKINSLHLGMSDREVTTAAGPPSRRESRETESGVSRETWTYSGQLSTLATLTFENGRLVQMQTN